MMALFASEVQSFVRVVFRFVQTPTVRLWVFFHHAALIVIVANGGIGMGLGGRRRLRECTTGVVWFQWQWWWRRR
jgi:hypothetical protein